MLVVLQGWVLEEVGGSEEISEGFFEPEVIPPLHGHEIAEPHVGQFVKGDVMEHEEAVFGLGVLWL